MPLSANQKKRITHLLETVIEKKIKAYKRETRSMPFLDLLIPNMEDVAAYSFIHSIATTLGQSIYEDLSCICAKKTDIVKKFYDIEGPVSNKQITKINKILFDLKTDKNKKSNKLLETDEILKLNSNKGTIRKSRVDFYLRRNNEEYLFEIKSPKPNIEEFKGVKEKLLLWIAIEKKKVHTFIAFPYDPYESLQKDIKYSRFTLQNRFDVDNEIKIGMDYWDFLGGKGTYYDILKIFDKIGKKYHSLIQDKINEITELKEKSIRNIRKDM